VYGRLICSRPSYGGSVQWWPAAWELGQFALLTEVVRSLAPGEFWQIGFATGAYDMESGRQWLKQFPIDTRLCLTPGDTADPERRAHFESTVRTISRSPHAKIVMMLTAPGHDTTSPSRSRSWPTIRASSRRSSSSRRRSKRIFRAVFHRRDSTHR